MQILGPKKMGERSAQVGLFQDSFSTLRGCFRRFFGLAGMDTWPWILRFRIEYKLLKKMIMIIGDILWSSEFPY